MATKVLKKRFNILFVIAALLVLISCFSFKNGRDRQSTILKLVMDQLEKQHFEARPIDNEFSKHVFEQFINSQDYNKHFYTLKDIKKLNKYKEDIDDQIKRQEFTFYNAAKDIVNQRIKESQALFQEILESPFDFTLNESYETDPEKTNYPKNDKEWREGWRKLLKYQVLSRLYTLNEEQKLKEKNNDSSFVVMSFGELEEKARKKVLKSNNDWFTRLNQLTDKDRFSMYINAITASYDPHTTYYPPKDKANFDIQMTGRLEGIGATLQQKDGYTKVTNIVPGSASWKQGDLKEGDIILKVAQGKKEPVDIVGMRLDEAVQLIRGKKGTEVRLTVKKIDGTITIIPIIRDVVVLEKTYAKSNVIQFNNENYGYIKLPKFYADFSGRGGRNCAEDVEKELLKLEGEDIEGVVLDLRNNGGGSLSEVVKMTGLFIDKGPIVQVKSKYGSPYILKDYQSGTTYDGPLIVLVNSFSASASEILAAAIQDYERGIIIGTGSTHGKGTVQRVLDLDETLRGNESIKPLGAMKLTTQKFYRVNGGATQLKGVEPDIVIPDRYSYLDVGEKELDFALKWDKIAASSYKKTPGNLAEAKDTIIENSTLRIKADTIYSKHKDYAKYLKEQNDISVYSLNYEKYVEDQLEAKEYTDKYDKISESVSELNVFSNQIDRLELASDSTKKASFETFNKKTSKDYYLVEALRVLTDLKETN